MAQLNIWIAITSLAVVIQAGILVALYVSVRKSSARMEAILSDLHKKTAPILESMEPVPIASLPLLYEQTYGSSR